jgi:hypothetical protein
LQQGQICPLAIDKNFLTMFKVGLLKVGASTNIVKGGVIVVHTAMKAMGIFVAGKQILFDTLGAGACVTEFTGSFLANNGSESVGTDSA